MMAQIIPFPKKTKELWGASIHGRMAEAQRQLTDEMRAYSAALKAGKMDVHLGPMIESFYKREIK
jgi:hypothetical protein